MLSQHEILESAKEAGLLHQEAETASQIVFDFAAIIERRTIERCAVVCESRYMGDNNREDMEARRCAAAIRKLGEQ